MSRGLIAVLWLGAGVASAEPSSPPPGGPNAEAPPVSLRSSPASTAPPDISDQDIGAEVGAAFGGRVTPGGVRVAGHYLYQLSDKDWFDGVAAFTFGGTGAGCFRDRMNAYVCDHGLADGDSAEIAATVRRFFAGTGKFWPYLRVGIGVAIVRFPHDDVSGLAIPLHAGGGVRVSVSSSVAVTAEAQLTAGVGVFGHSLGVEPQLGFGITAGAEFPL